MVKNTHGGSGHKKFARKDTNGGGGRNARLRVSECSDEMYAIATKMCGNNMVQVHCLDDILRLCHIRRNFSGRRKRDNFVSVGTWLLVGLRDYDEGKGSASAAASTTETSKKVKLPNCDLLEVYSSVEKEQLRNSIDARWNILTSKDTSTLCSEATGENAEGEIRFTTEHDDELDALLQSKSNATRIIGGGSAATAEIDVDDI